MSTSDTNAPMTITPEKRLRTTIGTSVLVIGAVISLTWGASTYLNKIDTAQAKTDARIEKMEESISAQIQALRMEVQSQGRRVWLAEEQFRWAGQLRWEFRKSEYVIPEPRDFRTTP
jgi:hypothetical protein